jgi:hypothetical protein
VFALSTVLYALDDQTATGSISAEYWDGTGYQAVSNSKLSTTSTTANSSAVFSTETLMQAQFTVAPATTTLVIKFVVASSSGGSRDVFGVGDVKVEYPLPTTTTQTADNLEITRTQAPTTMPLPPGTTDAPTTIGAGTTQPPGLTTFLNVTSQKSASFETEISNTGESASSVPSPGTVGTIVGVVLAVLFLMGAAIAGFFILKRRREGANEPARSLSNGELPVSSSSSGVSGHYSRAPAQLYDKVEPLPNMYDKVPDTSTSDASTKYTELRVPSTPYVNVSVFEDT